MRKNDTKALTAKLAKVKLLLCDVDGVLTKPYAGVFWGTRLLWDAPDRLHTLLRAGPDREATVVEVQVSDE